ncbi:hypothetical protein [uncultured Aliiroseovarius sp.]|uniref:hypothetical protein n=1 Tax=uncultured Aliiroseovarius sp. TaxID=1658783 RepID=UPI0026367733|nr:hypothetical protein [uncultured Aliiroseovarius sp.]
MFRDSRVCCAAAFFADERMLRKGEYCMKKVARFGDAMLAGSVVGINPAFQLQTNENWCVHCVPHWCWSGFTLRRKPENVTP